MKQGPGNLSDFLRDRGYQGRGGTHCLGSLPVSRRLHSISADFHRQGNFGKEPIMAKQQNVQFKVGRDARDGRFETVERARKDPSHHVVETIKRTVPPPAPTKKR